jgi:Xaa-Pro aminopeptidase
VTVTCRRVAVLTFRVSLIACLLLVVSGALPHAERFGYNPDEFADRRERLTARLDSGIVLLFGATSPTPGLRFRQDNDFFYLTGNESMNAALAMDVTTGQSHLFLPTQTDAEVRYEGANWLREPEAAARHNFQSVQPLSGLHEFLARRRGVAGADRLWVRLSERDTVNHGRVDTALQLGRRFANPFAQQPTEDAARIGALRDQYPYYAFRDLTPALDALRLIKTPREIEILAYNGRVSAEAVERAIALSGPGRFEYELEAEATGWLLRHGMQAAAYPAIVASGPNGNQWHYEENGRQMEAGDLVVMDYGGSLDQLTMDLTRTWPVAGAFTARQRAAYECVLEAQQTILAAIAPGVTRDTIQQLAHEIYLAHGFDPTYAYVGHYVGLSVHDVGDWTAPFKEGMVLAIEPIIDLPDEDLHIRIEDTVLVTATGAQVLTAAAPKEIDELLALVGTQP